ncbi:MAG TPA: hypothetical protein ENN68_01045 [Methanomicrobia archaeon]|nr:hypothetical protein [Methanomicrobia archaeon]
MGGKIVAAGGEIALNGTVKNLVAAGGEISIQLDAVITGQRISNAGTVSRNLTVRAGAFENTGSAGRVDYQKTAGLDALRGVMRIFRVLMMLGFLILGVILLKLFPTLFFSVEAKVRNSPLRNTAVGVALIIVSTVMIFVLTITIVGLPLAAVMGMLFVIALMLASIFVYFALGRAVCDALTVKPSDLLSFVCGFVLLALLFHIPVAGMFIGFGALSLGFGSILYAVRNNLQRLTAPTT